MRNKVQGFSLIELMISLTLSMSFLAVAASMMVTNKRDYIPLRDVARVTEGAAAALDVMGRDIERAGFFGENTAFESVVVGGAANSSSFVNRTVDMEKVHTSLYGLTRKMSADGKLRLSTAIEGYEGGAAASGFLPSGVKVFDDGKALDDATTGIIQASGAIPGPDAITIRGSFGGRVGIEKTPGTVVQKGPGVMLKADMAAVTASLELEDASNLPEKGYFIVYDAVSSELFRGKRTGNNIEIIKDPDSVWTDPQSEFTKKYKSSLDGSVAIDDGQAYVTVANFSRYYIGNDSSSGEDVPSLYREYYNEDSGANGEVIRKDQILIEGVENMQITYGEDTTPDDTNYGIDAYVTADQVTSWIEVKAVKIGILVRSETQSSIDATTGDRDYNVNGTIVPVKTKDRFFRKVFVTQLALDNGV